MAISKMETTTHRAKTNTPKKKQGTSYPAHRIITGLRKGKPYAYRRIVNLHIMRNAPLFPFRNCHTFRHGGALRDCYALLRRPAPEGEGFSGDCSPGVTFPGGITGNSRNGTRCIALKPPVLRTDGMSRKRYPQGVTFSPMAGNKRDCLRRPAPYGADTDHLADIGKVIKVNSLLPICRNINPYPL